MRYRKVGAMMILRDVHEALREDGWRSMANRMNDWVCAARQLDNGSVEIFAKD